jgi:short-subunit dehydrogenase
MNKLQFKNKWVLVTGASSGLGREMAIQLAKEHGANLILLARRREKMEELKVQLERETSAQIKIRVTDLSNLTDVDQALNDILADGTLYAAILNAGVTYFGPQEQLDWGAFQTMLQTNVTSVVRMTNRLLEHFEQSSNEGGILLVSSMAAMFPVPFQAAYSGTKSFILSFGSALRHEIKNPNLSITVFAPGGIATEMTDNEKFNDLKRWLMPVKQAAREALYGFTYRKAIFIPGTMNRIGNVLLKLLPRQFIIKKMSSMYKRSLTKAKSLR